MIDRLTSACCRVFFAAALLMLAVAVTDRILGLCGWQLRWVSYQPGRLLEFSGILMTFVIALVLRQIREALRKS